MEKETARSIPITDVCQALGLTWEKDSGGNAYFKSPKVPDQRTGSLSISASKSVWHDYATAESGDSISLVQYVRGTDFHGAMQWFEENFSFCETETQRSRSSAKPYTHNTNTTKTNGTGLFTSPAGSAQGAPNAVPQGLEIIETRELYSYPLKNYLSSRGIPPNVAVPYVKEIRYSNAGKEFYAVGFPNDAGGYELRSGSFKGAIAPKEVSFIHGSISGPKYLTVFEGFIDFLSALVYFDVDQPSWDTVVLNSTAMVNHVKPLLRHYKTVHCFLDNDASGIATLSKLKAMSANVVDRSMIYESVVMTDGRPAKDFNDFLLATRGKP